MHYKPCTDTDTHYKTTSTQSGQFLVTEKSARHSTITFIAPLSISPVDVQTEEPALGDTSIVSQSVTNNRCAPLMWGAQEKSGGGGTSKKFQPALRAGILPPPTCKLLPTPLGPRLWARGRTPQKTNIYLGVIFHAYGEKKPLVGPTQNFALREISWT